MSLRRHLKGAIDFLAYASMAADALITAANLIVRNLPPQISYNYYFIQGTTIINTQAINEAGQNLLYFILPLTAFIFAAYLINNRIEASMERKLLNGILDGIPPIPKGIRPDQLRTKRR